ncbi:MAG TPA: hypothetical protein VN848_10785 [Gemmatimonadales bacterium]|nr:hypothetical protein [Gemmatimonadales bacterium]
MRRVEPGQFIPSHKPELVSVWTRPDHVTFVSDPRIEGDTLIGTVLSERWAVPLQDVVRVEARTSDPRRTALLVAGAAASAVGVFLISSSGRGAGRIPCLQDYPPELRAELCGTTP